MTVIKIEGKRQTGKTTLLGHYIIDAEKAELKVLLTGDSLYRCKCLAESIKSDKLKVSTCSLFGKHSMYYNVLAIEEQDVNSWKKYVDKYNLNLAPGCIVVITGCLE